MDKRLKDAIAKIPDETTRSHYAKELRGKQWQLFSGSSRRDDRWTGNRKRDRRDGSQQTRPSLPIPAAAVDPRAGTALLEGASLLICALHPELVSQVETRLERLTPQDPDRAALLFDLLGHTESASGRRGLETLRVDPNLVPMRIGEKNAGAAAAYLREVLDRLEARTFSEKETWRAENQNTGEADEGLTWRFRQTGQVRHRLERFEDNDTKDLGEDRHTYSSYLDRMKEQTDPKTRKSE